MRDHEAIGRVVAMQDDACADTGDRTPKEPRASARAVIVRRRRPTHAVRCSPPTRRAVPGRQATADFHQETAPAEHVVYDAYGQATLYAWPSADVTGDGQVNIFDLVAVRGALNTISPLHDVNLDGAVDIFDLVSLRGQLDTSAVATTTSNVGNPYYFTGRLTDTLHASDLLTANDPHFRRLQDNRNRTYDPKHGRWLQRDPLAYPSGGMNLYEFVLSNPHALVDPSGEHPVVILLLGLAARGCLTGAASSVAWDILVKHFILGEQLDGCESLWGAAGCCLFNSPFSVMIPASDGLPAVILKWLGRSGPIGIDLLCKGLCDDIRDQIRDALSRVDVGPDPKPSCPEGMVWCDCCGDAFAECRSPDACRFICEAPDCAGSYPPKPEPKCPPGEVYCDCAGKWGLSGCSRIKCDLYCFETP